MGLYALDLASRPQWVVLNSDQAWPATKLAVNAVAIEFTSGFTAVTLPASLRRAVLTLVARWFDDRTDCTVPPGVIDACEAWRTIWIYA